MQDFHDLKVWQKSHSLTRDIYAATLDFPGEEKYGLISQMRRSAVSVGGNIAEGCGRQTRADFARFLHISLGSASELGYYVLLARDLGFLTDEQQDGLEQKVTEVKRMLTSLARKLTAKDRLLTTDN